MRSEGRLEDLNEGSLAANRSVLGPSWDGWVGALDDARPDRRMGVHGCSLEKCGSGSGQPKDIKSVSVLRNRRI
jgi:hypothetical protein